MMPVGPLMLEHRFIERMLRIIDKELYKMKEENKIDMAFIDTSIDFIKTYADRCHHGKEEDILFRDLAKKPLSTEHKIIINELIQEHILGRNNVKKVIMAKDAYAQGNENALNDIITNVGALVKFYPKHIGKEDKRFFIPCMDYFTAQERDNMLAEFYAFDKKIIGVEKYKEIVEHLERSER